MPGDPESDQPFEGADSLAARARAGEIDALRQLLSDHLPELTAYVRLNASRDLMHRESCSDVAQSVAADVLSELDGQRFADLAAFRAWLRRIAINKIIDKQRFHRAERRNIEREQPHDLSADEVTALRCDLESLPTPSRQAIEREDLELLRRALDRLPEDQRRVVTMARLLGLPHREIAAVTGRSEGACRMLLRRGMVALARELDT